jgi:hypothetical protein
MHLFYSLLVTAIGLFGCLGFAHQAAAQVAVLVDREWATVGRNDVMPAPVCAAALARHVDVTTLTAAELADPTRLDAAKLPVLVMAYGDPFPAAALDTLRKFRRDGGCLVMFGGPLQSAAKKAAGTGQPQWTTEPAAAVRRHDDAGLALFGTAGTVRHDRPCIRTVPGNPLGITPEMLESSLPNQQRLDPKSLPVGDELIPLVMVEQEGAGPALPIAAAIRHNSPQAKGCCDVWLGQTVWHLDAGERWFAEQLLVRGVLWCLEEKGLLDAAAVAARRAALDAIPKPAALPAGLPITRSARPWGESLVPKSPPPAKRLKAVALAKLPPDERAALCCFQGLTARREPSIWLLRSNTPNDQDRFWLDWHVECGGIEGYDIVDDWKTLVREHAAEIKGAVIADPACDRSDVIAMNVAACEDLILCTPALAEQLALPVKVDLRGKFTNYLEGMEWVWTTYRDRLCRHAVNYFHPARLAWGNVDQCYQWRIPMVWTSFKEDAYAAGADPAREHAFVAKVLAAMDTHSVVMGWPAFGPRLGIDEYLAVMQATPYSHGYVPSDGLANMTAMSGVRLPPLPARPAPAPAPEAKPGTIYLSLVISDGDNLSPWMQYFRDNYFAADAAPLPCGITICPTLEEAAPAMARWYFARARPDMEFLCGVSGATYISPEVFATRLADPQTAWEIFFDDTARSMRTMRLETINLSPRGEPWAEQYAKALPFCHSIITSWNRRTDDPAALTTILPGGTPSFWSGTANSLKFEPAADKDGGAAMAGAFYADLEKLAGKQIADGGPPCFICDIATCWEWKKDPLKQLLAQKPEHVVFVTPSQLAALVRRSK